MDVGLCPVHGCEMKPNRLKAMATHLKEQHPHIKQLVNLPHHLVLKIDIEVSLAVNALDVK